jgi:hypothetical protein
VVWVSGRRDVRSLRNIAYTVLCNNRIGQIESKSKCAQVVKARALSMRADQIVTLEELELSSCKQNS